LPEGPLSRTFGFELEVAGGANEVARRLRSAGLSLSGDQHGWHCHCCECNESFGEQGNWLKVQTDSSCGGEVISSILKWSNQGTTAVAEPNPTYLIHSLTDILIDLDTPIDQRCGLHVHVGARDLSDRQLGRLYELVHHHEAILYRLACGRAERHRGYDNNFNYCRPMSAFDNPVEAKELAAIKSAQVKASPIAYNKYIAANLMPVETLGTVEFRLWESTRSARRLEFYAKLSVALVERAKKRARPAGRALYLGDQGDMSDLMVFLSDLQRHVPELVDARFIELAHWQWNEGPADWQPAANLAPLPHWTRGGVMAITAEQAEQVVEQYDSHNQRIEVPYQYQREEEPTPDDTYEVVPPAPRPSPPRRPLSEADRRSTSLSEELRRLARDSWADRAEAEDSGVLEVPAQWDGNPTPGQAGGDCRDGECRSNGCVTRRRRYWTRAAERLQERARQEAQLTPEQPAYPRFDASQVRCTISDNTSAAFDYTADSPIPDEGGI